MKFGIAPSTGVEPWGVPPRALRLEPGEVHLWHARLSLAPDDLDAARRSLSPLENDRASRFRFEKDRKAYVAAAGILRDLLGRYLDRTPGSLSFEYGAEGKPRLPEEGPPFNLAHSGGWALLAVSGAGEVGVDLEEVRAHSDWEEIAKRFFTPEEVAVLLARSGADREQAFFRIWARKEAYIKGRGRGLSIPLNEFGVWTEAGRSDGRPRGEEESEFLRWDVRDVECGPGFAAAVAVRGFGWRVRRWRWRPA